MKKYLLELTKRNASRLIIVILAIVFLVLAVTLLKTKSAMGVMNH